MRWLPWAITITSLGLWLIDQRWIAGAMFWLMEQWPAMESVPCR